MKVKKRIVDSDIYLGKEEAALIVGPEDLTLLLPHTEEMPDHVMFVVALAALCAVDDSFADDVSERFGKLLEEFEDE